MHDITGKTQIVGLIGWPVSHSVSPQMHNAAFAQLNLDWSYIPIPVPTEPASRVGEAIQGLRALGIRGANVTVPHKQNVMPYMDQLTPAAKAIGAVNTIKIEADGSFLGHNTDAGGFVADLRDQGVDPTDKRVLLLGAGGSARAVVFGLAEAGSAAITILNRTTSKAEDLAQEMQALFTNCEISAGTLPGDIAQAASAADLVVNSTTVGMSPNIDSSPWDETVAFTKAQVAYDLIYNPPRTRLLQQAAANGASIINGMGMLVWQGALSFELWTGQRPSAVVMRQAIEAILAGR